MIKVYFENLGNNGQSNYAELVAIFDDENLYNICLPALEKEAKHHRMGITESVVEKDIGELDE